MAVNLSPIGNGFQFFTITGLPLAGGYLYTYQAGSTTPVNTYTDNGGTIANTNPIQLGTDGRPPAEIWLTYGVNYKFVLADSTNAVIQTYDNLYGIIGVQATSGATIPAGLISMWSGSIGSIPSGWYLCDGSNGTPNLTDRFIIGAGSTYAVNGTGGASTVSLTPTNLPAHTHTATSTSTVTDPGHNHIYYLKTGNGNRPSAGGNENNGYDANTSTAFTGITVATSTSVSGGGSGGASGTAFSILPTYYALAFIQKS
jgi:microcystin-dependent protein